MKIWLDTHTGAYGTDPENLVIFDATDDELEILDGGSDSDIIELGARKLRGA